MLIVKDQAHLDRVRAFARLKGPQYEQWLNQALWRLHIWADFNRDRIDDDNLQDILNAEWPATGIPDAWIPMACGEVQSHLHRDFAPASFGWDAFRAGKDEPYYGGGLIYHGAQIGWDADDRYTDPLSVTLSNFENENPWSIHS
jgi:hypothetical protein